MPNPRHPLLYQLNTRVYLTELARVLDRPVTLDDIPDEQLAYLRDQGLNWIWLLGVWQTGAASRAVSLQKEDWQREFRETLPDLEESDVPGSCFAIQHYQVHEALGGNEALDRFRNRAKQFGLLLLLDFVPNHVALDHPWVMEKPDFFIKGSQENLDKEPHNYTLVAGPHGNQILAFGRDPYFPGWPDTLQLNYANPEVQQAMIQILLSISGLCDGLRCDMAMLVEPEVFERTWGMQSAPFWLEAIDQVKNRYPAFLFMAEVYWGMEHQLQQHGFDYTYDKALYDKLKARQPYSIKEYFAADLDFQNKSVRFLENHDEERAAKIFSPDVHKAAAILTYCNPGMRFFHQGQLEGKKVRISPHLGRGPIEATDLELNSFYDRLLDTLKQPVLRNGDWERLHCRSVGGGNVSWDNFIGWTWYGTDTYRLLLFVNFTFHASECFVDLPFEDIQDRNFELVDLMSDTVYERSGDSLLNPGLYLYMSGWGFHIFELREKLMERVPLEQQAEFILEEEGQSPTIATDTEPPQEQADTLSSRQRIY